MHANGQILSHLTILNSLNSSSLESVAELLQLGVLVEGSTVEQTSSPGIDAGD